MVKLLLAAGVDKAWGGEHSLADSIKVTTNAHVFLQLSLCGKSFAGICGFDLFVLTKWCCHFSNPFWKKYPS